MITYKMLEIQWVKEMQDVRIIPWLFNNIYNTERIIIVSIYCRARRKTKKKKKKPISSLPKTIFIILSTLKNDNPINKVIVQK